MRNGIDKRTRRRVLLVTPLAALALGAASVAWACTALATIDLNPGAAPAGSTVSGIGHGFSYLPIDHAIQIRWDSASGPVLQEIPPDLLGRGEVTFDFKVPTTATVGFHTVVATQTDVLGNRVAGTPARASMQVTG